MLNACTNSLTSKEGEFVNAVYGFAMTMLAVLEKFHPEYIAASFDLAGPTFRHEKFAEYKATRVKAPDDLYAQIPRVKELVQAFNIPIYEKEGFEADDCVGTLARQAEQAGVEVIIVSGDTDTLQLVTPNVKVFTMRKGIKDTVLYDEKGVEAKFGFKPAELREYKGLCGDASDNIPGVKGIGQKTATDLIQKYSTLEKIYESLDELKPKVKEKLEQEKETAFLSRELGIIDTNAPVALNLPDAVVHEYDRSKVTELFRELGFFSLLKRLPEDNLPASPVREQGGQPITYNRKREKKAKSKKLETKEETEKYLETHASEEIAVWVEKNEGSLFGDSISSLKLATKDGEAVIDWNESAKKYLKDFLENAETKKVVYNGKRLLHLFHQEGIAFEGISFDVMIAAYLLNSGGNVEFGYIVLDELGLGETDREASALLLLREAFEKKMDQLSVKQQPGKTIRTVFEQIEMPLIKVLFEMEQRGILLNTKKFQTLSEELTKELAQLEKDIYVFAGKEFNINSPKQLAVILFEDLKIPTADIKKTKSGFSTASTELAKLQEYPIVQKIESYRELFKLKTTYLDALPVLIGKDSRLHTTFHQTVAATGRLSSSDPNLQNIPARHGWSERIRGAFEAEPGFVLVGADYSQIELRVMAHMSDDQSLVESFRKNEDIHKTTASVVFKVKPEDVTPDMRRQAKVFNFGIMYGMGPFGLAQAAKIDQKDASKFIAEYFKKFAGVKAFMEHMREVARTEHCVETELGRRRYIPEIESQNVMVAKAAERMAINMPIQGLAADIMKLAMLKAEQLVQAYGDLARMVLQVHDELIFEVKEEQAQEFSEKIKEVMANAYPLRVPLVAEVEIGKNWGEI